MSRRTRTVVALALLAMIPTLARAETRPYKHPRHDLQFTAPVGWNQVPRPGDAGTHELVDPETGIHVLMWLTSTEQGPADYLGKMSGMMDLDLVQQSQPRDIGGREFQVLDVPGRIDGRDVHTLLAVAASGRSRERPRENLLHVVQVWCPAADQPRLARSMDEVLATVRITDRVMNVDDVLWLYPETTTSPPDLPSPWQAPDGGTYLTVRTAEGRYGLVMATVENGAPNAYADNGWDKGRQLVVDAADFPALARTGLHDPDELDRVTSITGRALPVVTADARPGGLSGSGFLAADEELIPVLKADNELVRRLGLTHPDLARPLFHVFNVILRDLELYRQRRAPLRYFEKVILYNGHEIRVNAEGGKGWQESIFADEVLGYWQIVIRREPTFLEQKYLAEHYDHLGETELADLTRRLTTITTGEMVPFYIQRYGFYEGQVFYRADPLAIAYLFGLKDLPEVDAAAGGDLSGALGRAP